MDVDQLILNLQGHFSDGLVTIVGSGLSCAEGLPGMGDLADHLRIAVPKTIEDPDRAQWAKIEPLFKIKGLEATLLEEAPSASLETIIVAATAECVLQREQKVISEVFAGKRVLRLTRLLKHLLKPDAGLPIITTNYDRLVEVAAEEANLGVDSMFVGQFAGDLNEKESQLSFCRRVTLRKGKVHYEFRPRAIVLKPHGSLDWYYRAGRPVRYSGDLPDVPRLIIPPGRNKFRNGYESPFDRQREKANMAIDRASRFLIIGYGFNDDHLETHLAPAIRAGNCDSSVAGYWRGSASW